MGNLTHSPILMPGSLPRFHQLTGVGSDIPNTFASFPAVQKSGLCSAVVVFVGFAMGHA
jgi:hypothetical protein